jgi:colanic acid biosynthesis glycosyl transferase WcaI
MGDLRARLLDRARRPWVSKLNVVVLNQFFPPDLAPTGQMAADLAEDLVLAGHQVTVVASRGSYLGRERLPDRSSRRGVDVHRVAATSLGKRTLAHRALDYASFYASAGLALSRMNPPAVVIAMTTPPLIAAAGLAAKRKGSKLVCWVQDLYPEIAVAFGALREGSPSTRAMAALSRKVMAASASVVVLGEAMKEKAIQAGAAPDRVAVIPNWADGDVIRPVPHESNPLRDDLARGARFVVLYSGNIGRAHDVTTLVQAAKLLATRLDIAFVFQGDGAKRAELVLATRGLPNVRFAPYQPREKLSESLSAADLHLITLAPNVLGLLEPSKLYGVMAAGRPSVYVGPGRSEVARTIRAEDIGACVENGDATRLVDAIVTRAAEPSRGREEGGRARAAFDREYSRPRRTARFARLLESLA